MLNSTIREQIKERYTAVELVELLDVSVDEIIDIFDYLIEDKIYVILDKENVANP